MDRKLFLEEESYAIRGAIFEVYRELGCGFLEAVYQECLEKELAHRNIPFVAQPPLEIYFKGEKLKQTYKPDLICYGSIVVKLKALCEIAGEHKAQLLNYLKATGHKVGLLVNFGTYPKAVVERLVL